MARSTRSSPNRSQSRPITEPTTAAYIKKLSRPKRPFHYNPLACHVAMSTRVVFGPFPKMSRICPREAVSSLRQKRSGLSPSTQALRQIEPAVLRNFRGHSAILFSSAQS